MFRRAVSWELFCAGVLASGVSAAPVTVYFTGTVTSISDPFNALSAYQVGDAVYGSYRYESNTPDTDSDPGHGDYFTLLPPSAFTIQIGGIPTAYSLDVQMEVYNDWPTLDDIFSIGSQFVGSPPCSDGFTVLTFKDTTRTAHTSDALLTGPPVFSDYNIHAGTHSVFCDPPGGESRLEFEINSTSAFPVIPAVSQAGLMALTLLLVLCAGTILRRRDPTRHTVS